MTTILAATIDGRMQYLRQVAGEIYAFRPPVDYVWTDHLSAGACWLDSSARYLAEHLSRRGVTVAAVDRNGRDITAEVLGCPSCGEVAGQPTGTWCASCRDEFGC